MFSKKHLLFIFTKKKVFLRLLRRFVGNQKFIVTQSSLSYNKKIKVLKYPNIDVGFIVSVRL